MSDVDFEPMEESRWSEDLGSQGIGERIFVCKYEDRKGSWAPVPYVSRWTDGLGWPSCWEDNLVCSKVNYEYSGAAQPGESPINNEFSYCRLVASYATIDPITSWEVEDQGKREFLEVGLGRKWLSDGAYSDQSLAVPFYHTKIVASRLFLFNNMQINKIRAAVQCVNSQVFYPPWGDSAIQPGYAQLETYSRRIIKHSYWGLLNHITFYFLVGQQDFNTVWRIPSVQRNSDGSVYYDGSGFPIFLGTPGWDKYETPLFNGYDFAQLIQ